MELPSPRTLVNAHTVENVLGLDELEAELILVQHIQYVQKSEAVLVADRRKKRQFPHHSSPPTCLVVPSTMMQF